MFWSRATPLRRRRDALGSGREVLVYIDEPLAVETTLSASPSQAVSSAQSGNRIFGDKETPVRRNTNSVTCDETGRNETPIVAPNRSNTDAERGNGDFLAIPELQNDEDFTATAHAETTPASDFVRVSSVCSSAGSRGHDDDSEASDDDDSLSNPEEKFERAVIKISHTDGCIVLEYPEEDEGSQGKPRTDNLARAPKEVERNEIHPGDGQEGDEEKSYDGGSEAGSSVSSSSYHDADEETWENEPCQFELQSTNIHSAEDDRQREHDKIRLAVLGAAADAYRKINVEVPDLILAQINESRETMRLRSCGKNLSGLGIRNEFGRTNKDQTQGMRGGEQECTNAGKLEDNGTSSTQIREDGLPRDQKKDGEQPVEIFAKPTKPRLRTKKLQLRPEDEIHALPCQCALTLVGMRGSSHLTPPNKSPLGSDSNQLAESFISHGLLGADSSIKTTKEIAQMTPDRRPSLPVLHSAPARPPSRSRSFLGLIGGGGGANEQNDDNLVRTSSAQAADISLPSRTRHVPTVATPEFLSGPSRAQWSPPERNGSLKLGGPPDLGALKRSRSDLEESIFPQTQPGRTGMTSREQRCEASSFTSMGYHEIVLLRRGRSAKENSSMFDSWDAVTIRCENHDEMDVIVSSLSTWKSTVVPFSPNPKARLKKMQEKERAALKKRLGLKANRNKKRRNSKISSPEIRLPRRGTNKETISADTHCSVRGGRAKQLVENSKEGRIAESKQWNKCDHCEICMVNFTLLVRRHHCRECDQSCCGNCSSVVLLSGSSRGKRLCTRCSPKVEDTKKKSDESMGWSREDHCEICLCHFTLLTRRHHCRKCDKSVCSNCSSVLLVRGGEEKRYCNRCSTDILRRQSRELHRRFAGYQRRMTSVLLPGKVHNDCRRLGVGVLGKLPHWRNYLSLNQNHRPAVGRITVELLEALAVPAIDVNGKADPYVRATITGYDRDMRWNLKEWNKIFSLCSSYCMGTLSPIWRGSGKRGGELLTLPVISTAGAVLRLEVMHYDILTNRRGRDVVLGVVEIPLSDITNANLRKASASPILDSKGKKKLTWDGYCDRWYQLQRAVDLSEQMSMVAKPISDPHLDEGGPKDQGMKPSDNHRSGGTSNRKNASLEELGQRFQGWCRVPVEWVGSALNIDFPPWRADTLSALRSRSAIHVRLKLNCNEVGDLLSHVWFPPVEAYPPVPPYDPNILWRNILRVGKQVKPYQKICKFIEDTIKWRHPARICIQSYFVLAFHLGVFPHALYFLHIYLFSFLMFQLQKTARANLRSAAEGNTSSKAICQVESFSSSEQVDILSSESDSDGRDVDEDAVSHQSMRQTSHGNPVVNSSPSLKNLSSPSSKKKHALEATKSGKVHEKNEETARLHKAVQWIAKRLGDNRGLEILQFKLGMLGKDLTNLNSLWDGSSAVKICASMNVVFVSFVLHCYLSWRLLWIGGTGIWFFGSSPFSIRRTRNMLGFWRGMAKVIRRRKLHEVEARQLAKNR